MNDEINKKADDIAQTMRELLETAENDIKIEVYVTLNQTDEKTPFQTGQIRLSKDLHKSLIHKSQQIKKMLITATKNVSKGYDINTKKIEEDINKHTTALIASAMTTHKRAYRNVVRLEKTVGLREAIFKQTQKGIESAMPIKTKNGSMGYKEYMEMNVRTTIQHEIVESQLKYNSKAGVVFYISNVYADSADDHADYQGKLYYDERFTQFQLDKETLSLISKKIKADNLISVQDVKNKKPYLTTRPNCRHKLLPISLEQALKNSTGSLVSQLNLSTGTYRTKNYEDTKKQRYNERQIRKYKARAEMNEKLFDTSGDVNYSMQSNRDMFLVRKWQARQRKLIDSNPVLERDYRREAKNIVLKDLGAKYNQVR